MKVTHLNLQEDIRTLAAMRAAMLGRSMTDYVSDLVLADAEQSGLAALMRDEATNSSTRELK